MEGIQEEQYEREVLENFIEEIVTNSTNLEGEIVDMVNKHFWELLLKID